MFRRPIASLAVSAFSEVTQAGKRSAGALEGAAASTAFKLSRAARRHVNNCCGVKPCRRAPSQARMPSL